MGRRQARHELLPKLHRRHRPHERHRPQRLAPLRHGRPQHRGRHAPTSSPSSTNTPQKANAILHHTLTLASTLATALNDTALATTYLTTATTLKTAANAILWSAPYGLYLDNETTTLTPQDGNAWAILANLTANATQAAQISAALASRWTAFGAPAPEAADAISPFISGFELQAHILAGNASAALALARLQWGFMLDDPRMTNSTFIEGYSTSGALHYAPYTNDARISHAHGWATGPTSTLSFLVAGIRLGSAGGETWVIAPSLGDLTRVEAGFVTSLGRWAVSSTKDGGTGALHVEFETPEGTSGVVRVEYPECDGQLVVEGEETVTVDVRKDEAKGPADRVEVEGLKGGKWSVDFKCSSS